MKFLELYFGGALMKDAARAAGYRGASPQALCNSAKRVLTKFSKTPQAFFRRAGTREKKIAELLFAMTDDSRPGRQLIALTILAKCIGIGG
jgi:hypothetical protein